MDKAIQTVRALLRPARAARGADGDFPRARREPRSARRRARAPEGAGRRCARCRPSRQLEADGNGRRCAEGLSHFQDELIRARSTTTPSPTSTAPPIPSDAERMAIVATGGYGRGAAGAGSDIDLLFLLPYKQTPWGESVAEYMLYMLWDLGFKVGHATRTVDQCLKLALPTSPIRTALLDVAPDPGRRAAVSTSSSERFRTEVVHGTARAVHRRQDGRARRAPPARRREPLQGRAQHQGRQGRPARPAHAALAGEVPLRPGRRRRRRSRPASSRPEEVTTFRRCEDFLWTVRCLLHFLTGRAEERLTFDVQPGMAERLGYDDRGGLQRRRALHEALLPGRQGRRRPDDHPVLGAGDAAAQGLARASAGCCTR